MLMSWSLCSEEKAFPPFLEFPKIYTQFMIIYILLVDLNNSPIFGYICDYKYYSRVLFIFFRLVISTKQAVLSSKSIPSTLAYTYILDIFHIDGHFSWDVQRKGYQCRGVMKIELVFMLFIVDQWMGID